jgi:hypothetical protein
MSSIVGKVEESSQIKEEIQGVFQKYLDDISNDLDFNKIYENSTQISHSKIENVENRELSSEMKYISPSENELDDLENFLESMINEDNSQNEFKNVNYAVSEEFINKYSTSRTRKFCN